MSWRLGVVGAPIEHSRSPVLQRAALAALGLEGTAEAIRVTEQEARDGRLRELLTTHQGLSVTMPVKEAALAVCDDVDPVAQRTRSVNSLLVVNGIVRGRSTDGVGFIDALAETGRTVEGRTVLVRGAGGSARAIVNALCANGAHVVAVQARNDEAARLLAATYPAVVANPRAIADVALVVNTVPAGTGDESLPAVTVTFAADAIAVDVRYEPYESEWLAAHRLAGRATLNGLAMLVHQARHQFEWWFEREVPIAALWAAVR